ncbi:MAG: hypothetical protein IKI84_01505 [Clostridia bacterium]|nr:hypothetical protein [Clostridia bacterium]
MYTTQNAKALRPPMKWHCFLTYFGIWVSALMCAGEAFLWFSGNAYGRYVYSTHPGLRMFDIVTGILYIVQIAMLLSARGKLSRLETEGPKALNGAHIMLAVMPLLTSWISSSIAGRSFNVTFIGSFSFVLVIVGVLGWIVNALYYHGREEAFC